MYRDPEIVRAEELVEDSVIAKETHTATKMLNKFRQMEENLSREPQPTGNSLVWLIRLPFGFNLKVPPCSH